MGWEISKNSSSPDLLRRLSYSVMGLKMRRGRGVCNKQESIHILGNSILISIQSKNIPTIWERNNFNSLDLKLTWPIPNGAPITPTPFPASCGLPRRIPPWMFLQPASAFRRRPTFKTDAFIVLNLRERCSKLKSSKRTGLPKLTPAINSLTHLATQILTSCRQNVIRLVCRAIVNVW